MRFLMLGLLFAVGCAGKAPKVAAAPKAPPVHLVMVGEFRDFLFLFPNKEKATEWCFERGVLCRGMDVEIVPVPQQPEPKK